MKPLKNSRHHLIPKHGEELCGTNNPDNIKMLTQRFHNNFHSIFRNLEPHNQLDFILGFNSSVLQGHVIKEVRQIIHDDYKYVYKNGLYIPKS